jgi:hypothetical protein
MLSIMGTSQILSILGVVCSSFPVLIFISQKPLDAIRNLTTEWKNKKDKRETEITRGISNHTVKPHSSTCSVTLQIWTTNTARKKKYK